MDNQQNQGFSPQNPPQNPAGQPNPYPAQPTTPVFGAGNAIPNIGSAPQNPGQATLPANNSNQVSSAVNYTTGQSSRVKTAIIIVMSLVAVTFIGLFIWMYVSWSELNTDVEGKIQKAVALAVDENTEELETEFTEREKSPYRTFSGPSDYGGLTFEYPKTWSVYIAQDASGNSDFEAYLNPVTVPPVGSGDINALRVSIRTTSYDEVADDYASEVEDGQLSVTVRQVGGTNVSVYTGMIDDEYQGILALIKIRDKVAILQTDASAVFGDDFYHILDTVSYNL